MACYAQVIAWHHHSLHRLSITTQLSRSNTGCWRKLGLILLERTPQSYELPLNSSATSRRTGWKITRSFGRSRSGTMALTISSGRRSWSNEYRKLWPRPGGILRVKSIKFVLLNSYCFAREHGLRNTPELKECA